MDEQKFIEKYKDKEITLKTYEVDDLFTYLIFVNGEPLAGLEEEIFWTLLPQTKVLYHDKDTEILKLII